MTVRIKKISESLYSAELMPDMSEVGEHWTTLEPMRVDQIINELLSRGAHQIDIGDAFYAADPHWLSAFSIGSQAKAYVCREVLGRSHPILLVSRIHGDWCFLCGSGHAEDASEYIVVAVGYAIDSDRTLLDLHDLPIGWKAERQSADSYWVRTPLDTTKN